MRDIHFSKVIIKKPYDIVWKWISNPLTYPQIYPSWLSEVKEVDVDSYEGYGPNGEFQFTRLINKEYGIVDLKIGEEQSRTRLFSLDKESTVVIHLAVRWEKMKNPFFWFFYKISVNSDFKKAKKIIETSE